MRLGAQTLSVMQQQSGDEEAFEYNSLLRHGIFEAYSGILNGMSQAKCDQYLRPFVPVRASPSSPPPPPARQPLPRAGVLHASPAFSQAVSPWLGGCMRAAHAPACRQAEPWKAAGLLCP